MYINIAVHFCLLCFCRNAEPEEKTPEPVAEEPVEQQTKESPEPVSSRLKHSGSLKTKDEPTQRRRSMAKFSTGSKQGKSSPSPQHQPEDTTMLEFK